MPFRRRETDERKPAGTPADPVVARAARAVSALERTELSRRDPGVLAAARAGVAAIEEGVERLARTRAALAGLDADRVATELKDARRRLQLAAPSERPRLEALVSAAENRYLTLHRLWDRVEAMEREHETLVADVENLVAVAAELDARVASPSDVGESLSRLQQHLRALGEAYDELETLQPGRIEEPRAE